MQCSEAGAARRRVSSVEPELKSKADGLEGSNSDVQNGESG
jgi:hypothetical protein